MLRRGARLHAHLRNNAGRKIHDVRGPHGCPKQNRLFPHALRSPPCRAGRALAFAGKPRAHTRPSPATSWLRNQPHAEPVPKPNRAGTGSCRKVVVARRRPRWRWHRERLPLALVTFRPLPARRQAAFMVGVRCAQPGHGRCETGAQPSARSSLSASGHTAKPARHGKACSHA